MKDIEMTAQKAWEEIDEAYGLDARLSEEVASYTGEEFAALDGSLQTTTVLLYVAGSDADGWIITTQDVYEDGETTIDGGTDQAGRTVYETADAARDAAVRFAQAKREND